MVLEDNLKLYEKTTCLMFKITSRAGAHKVFKMYLAFAQRAQCVFQKHHLVKPSFKSVEQEKKLYSNEA